jgi:hypothetical protein
MSMMSEAETALPNRKIATIVAMIKGIAANATPVQSDSTSERGARPGPQRGNVPCMCRLAIEKCAAVTDAAIAPLTVLAAIAHDRSLIA